MKKTIEPENPTFLVTISVDKQKLREARKGLDNPVSLIENIENEFGWLNESGIYFKEIKKIN